MKNISSRLQKSTIFLFIFCFITSAVIGAPIGVYNGPGTWSDGIKAFEKFLNWKGISHSRIGPNDINNNDLRGTYEGIYFPGGDASYYWAAINENGIQHIRDLVNDGGAYIGICAGAYFAADVVEWEGGTYDYPLDLFMGTAGGAISSIAPWPDYTMTTINMNQSNQINKYEPPTELMLYYGGPAFYPHSGCSVKTTATWAAYGNKKAIINFKYGSGRVLLIGPHPEIEEDSNRDGTNFAGSYGDEGTDWGFLWSAMDWTMGWSVSQAPQRTLNIQANPADGGSTEPPVGTHSYTEGNVVNISANPVINYEFVDWTGNVANSTSPDTKVTLDSDEDVTANFMSSVPVELSLFEAQVKNKQVVLTWRTESETNNLGFGIQRKKREADLFREIDFVAGHGTVAIPQEYQYVDNSVYGGIYFYRLKQVDLDGAIEFSEIRQIALDQLKHFKLMPNYPNPFNPATLIRYSLPQNAHVTLAVYNSAGKRIARLVNEQQPAGEYSIPFQGLHLASGIYWCALKADEFRQVRKMILMK